MTSTTDSTSQYIAHEPTYHTNKDAAYVLPNDAPEHVRLETQARHLSAIMNNQIIHAPIAPSSKNLRMLDVGCGTGIVSDSLGTRFPNAEVFGLDLSPVPLLGKNRPSNVRFLQGNIVTDRPGEWRGEGESPFPNDTDLFDLVYSRLLVCGLTTWSQYIQTAFRLLKPSGYMEIHDLDWIWYNKANEEISDKWPWWNQLKAAGEARGLDWQAGSKTRTWMREAGFVDIQVKEYRWPFGGQWEETEAFREFGEYVRSNMVSMVWHMIPRLLQESRGKFGDEDVKRMREDMQRDFQLEEGKHWVMYVTTGRKP